MFPLEFETSLAMIKILRASDDAERLFCMALGAVLTELIVVNILVTV